MYSTVSWVPRGYEEFNAHDRIMNIVTRFICTVYMANACIRWNITGLGKNTVNARIEERARGGFFLL